MPATGQPGGAISLTFTPMDWNVPQMVTVTAVDDGVINGQGVKVFAAQPRTVVQVQGPLFISGGIDPTLSLTTPPPLLFVGETDGGPFMAPPNQAPDALPSQQVNILNVLNDDSVASLAGTLTDTTITGLGMGAGLSIAGQTFPGGITYDDIQDLQIDLGHGNDNFLVERTDGGSTTIVGGSGNDQVNIESTGGPVTVNGGSGASTIDVGTAYNGSYFGVNVNHFTAPPGGVLAQIAGLLRIDGGTGNSTVNLDDSGNPADAVSDLSGSSLLGSDLHPAVVQVVTVNNAIGGSFTLQVGPNGPTTAALPYQVSAARLQAALLALNLPNVLSVTVNDAGNTYTIGFIGNPVIATENLTITANGSGLVADISGTLASVSVQASSLDLVQSLTVNASAGAFPVTIGNNLATVVLSIGESADAFQSALISAISSTNLVSSANGVPLGINDVLVDQVGNTYYVTYQGLLGGKVGNQFSFSEAPAATVTQQGASSVELGSIAVRGTYTLSPGASLATYSLAWNATAADIQAALSSLLNDNLITVVPNAGGYLIAGLPPGVAPGFSIDTSQLVAPLASSAPGQGIEYNHVATLNLDLGPHDNVVNVQGTTAVTNIFGHGGNEQFFVSSLADESLQTAPAADFLLGNLAGILGNLNLAAGAGTHKLYISNEGSVSGVASGVITSVATSPTALPGTEIEVRGFAPRRSTIRQRREPRAALPGASRTGQDMASRMCW